jgi:hypothetical protein
MIPVPAHPALVLRACGVSFPPITGFNRSDSTNLRAPGDPWTASEPVGPRPDTDPGSEGRTPLRVPRADGTVVLAVADDVTVSTPRTDRDPTLLVRVVG